MNSHIFASLSSLSSLTLSSRSCFSLLSSSTISSFVLFFICISFMDFFELVSLRSCSSSDLFEIRSFFVLRVNRKKETSSSNSTAHLYSLRSFSICSYIFDGLKKVFACFAKDFSSLSYQYITHVESLVSMIQSV